MNWNVSGLIIEGISGTGKTSVLKSLLKHREFLDKPFISSVVFSEHQTQRVLEYKEKTKGLKPADNIGLLTGIVETLELFNNRLGQTDFLKRKRGNHKLVYLLERFHLTHIYHYDHMGWEMVKGIDKRLNKLNAKMCVLKVKNEIIEDRIITNRKKGWVDYLKRYGKTKEEIVKYYIERQEEVLVMSELSSLPTIVIDTTNSKVEDVVNKIIKFWGIF